MPVHVVALTTLNPNAERALETYLGVVGPLMESAGATVVSRYQFAESVAGANEFQFLTLVEYPDEASWRRVFDSDEYKSLEDVKALAFANYQVNTTFAI